MPTFLLALLLAAPLHEEPWRAELLAMRALPLPAVGVDDLPVWRAYVLPGPDELVFEQVEWLPSFAAGLRAAARAERPLFLWAMNGHPLGCT